jgi:hypothetical protein
MARFFFHVRNGKTTLKDEGGEELADVAKAVEQAAVIARELADDDHQWRGHSVVVVDERGREIGRLLIGH